MAKNLSEKCGQAKRAFERRLRRRNRFLGEASEGAVEAPADDLKNLADEVHGS